MPSHTGTAGIARAEELAKTAISNTAVQPSSMTRIDYRAFIKYRVGDSWKNEWLTLDSNILRDITSSLKHLLNTDSKNREWQSCLTRLRVGQRKLTHGFLMSRDDPPEYENGNVQLTDEHILVHCREHEGLGRK